MPVILDKKGNLFRPFNFKKESDFEAIVVELADQIFGASTIYIDKKKGLKGSDILTIPDGYLIDLTEPQNPKLFVIENEIVSHDPFRHIGIQMLKFVTSFEDSKVQLRNFLMNEISKNPEHSSRLEAGCKNSNSRNIDNYLDMAVYGDFCGIVVIDEARNELHRVLEKINANISVIELKTFESDDGIQTYQFDTLYDEFEEGTSPISIGKKPKSSSLSKEERARRRARRIASDTIIVPAKEDGFKRVFLGEDQWHAIRIGAAMKERIKFIAGYQIAPISAVTHLAEVKEIRPYKDSGKYVVHFRGPAKEIKPIRVKVSTNAPQCPVYVKKDKLLKSSYLEEALK